MNELSMLQKAMKNNYIVPAFNFTNFEILKGIIEASIETKSPIILQVSESAMNYFTDELLKGIIVGIRQIKHPISIHLDHGKTLAIVKRAINLGFDSVMIDGSTLPFEENVKLTKQVVNYAHKRKVVVEGEIGSLAHPEDDSLVSSDAIYTNKDEALKFVKLTNVDSLAISIGTNHGINKYAGEPKIRYDILKEIEQVLPSTPIVLHGASLVEQKYIDSINKFGGKIEKSIGNENLLKDAYATHISKINMDTDYRLAYTSAIREYMFNYPSVFCPREYGKIGTKSVKECAMERIINICHSNNKI